MVLQLPLKKGTEGTTIITAHNTKANDTVGKGHTAHSIASIFFSFQLLRQHIPHSTQPFSILIPFDPFISEDLRFALQHSGHGVHISMRHLRDLHGLSILFP
jgi:hypothetical protein